MIIPRLSHPLPLAEKPAESHLHRREHAGSVVLDPASLIQFNQRIGRLVGTDEEFEPDRFASIARLLMRAERRGRHPACIVERLRCAAAMEMMLRDDKVWQPKDPAGRICREVIDYLRSDAQLVPNSEPVVGWLDDAILIDRVWPLAEHEVLLYCDFRRLRQIEAELAGRPARELHFERADYFEARSAEARLLATERRIGLGSYAPPRAYPEGLLLS